MNVEQLKDEMILFTKKKHWTKIRKLKENGKEIENKLGSYQDNIRINLYLSIINL